MPLAADLNDDLLTEILLRLPPKSVLRSRAVCKQWRRAATCASFVAAYSRRRPLDIIFYPERLCGREYAIDRVPLDGGDGFRRLLDHGRYLKYFGSCDGLLLFSLSCARFPALAPTPCMWVVPSAFYLHRPSGEHRVLCFAKEIPAHMHYDSTDHVYKYHADDESSSDNEDDVETFRLRPVHYELSTGAAQPRRLGPFAEYRGHHPFPPFGVDVGGTLHWARHPWTGAAQPRRLGPFAEYRGHHPFPPFGVDVGGTLHWARHPWTGGNSSTMLAFDTVSETFRQMPLPPVAAKVSDHLINLFDMRGTLALSAMGEWPYLDVWALDDYAVERWSHHVRVELTIPAYRVKYAEAVAALEGGVLVLFAVGGWVTLYDVKEKRTVRVVRHGDNDAKPRWCLYRESLVPAVIDGLPCSSGGVLFDDQLKAEFAAIGQLMKPESVAINYSLVHDLKT
ncbi:unnamed protein product [Alopecurus aequalis]